MRVVFLLYTLPHWQDLNPVCHDFFSLEPILLYKKRDTNDRCRPPSPSFSSIGSQDDHPADANYYFSSGEQGRCYLAPERFYSAPQASEGASAAGGAGGAGAAATGAPRAAGGAGAGLAGARGAGLDGLVGAYFWTKGRCD